MASRASSSVILAGAISLNGVREILPPKRQLALARFSSAPERVLFPTPEEAALHLATGAVSEIVLLWRAGLKASADGAGFAASFLPPGGEPRMTFRLVSVTPAPKEFGSSVVALYRVKN